MRIHSNKGPAGASDFPLVTVSITLATAVYSLETKGKYM